MNRVVLMGRLTRDPDIKIASDGSNVATYTLAVDKDYPERLLGNKADFFKCIAFGRNADFADKYLKKGIKIIIWGKLQNNKVTGRDEIVIKDQEFTERKRPELEERERIPIERKNFDSLKVDEDGFVKLPENFDEDLPF